MTRNIAALIVATAILPEDREKIVFTVPQSVLYRADKVIR